MLDADIHGAPRVPDGKRCLGVVEAIFKLTRRTFVDLEYDCLVEIGPKDVSAATHTAMKVWALV